MGKIVLSLIINQGGRGNLNGSAARKGRKNEKLGEGEKG